MSSDGHVSDHGRQAVDSIEEFDNMELDSYEDEDLNTSRDHHAKQSEKIIERDEGSDSGAIAGEGRESGDERDLSVDVALRNAVPKKANALVDGAELEAESELPEEQVPPSHQVSPGGSEGTPDDADSPSPTQSRLEVTTPIDLEGSGEDRRCLKRKSAVGESGSVSINGDTDFRPVKKAKGSFNRKYLDLLNKDIEHAASQYIPHFHDPPGERMRESQVGMTVWTALEKEHFFEALGRLGRDNTAAIARRVRTKDEMEIRQYLKLLQDGLAHLQQQRNFSPLRLADFPAAVELSHECCLALEDAADTIAMRQNQSENVAEERKHGSNWLVSQDNYQDLAEDEMGEDASKTASVLKIRRWLSMPCRFFMNAPTVEGNWQSVEGDTPSIRFTALEDFHSVALTLTRRLLAASLYMATSRIRAERRYRPELLNIVRTMDVHAAALSLGLATKRPRLTDTARRLGLLVYTNLPKRNEDSETEPMSYEAVETALGAKRDRGVSDVRGQLERIALSSNVSPVSSPLSAESEDGDGHWEDDSANEADSEEEEEEDLKADIDEAILYSAVDPPAKPTRHRKLLVRRIKAEQIQDEYADAADAHASYQEEVRMWDLLGKEPPQTLQKPKPKPDAPLPYGSRTLQPLETIYTVGKDWREKTHVISEWEARYQGMI